MIVEIEIRLYQLLTLYLLVEDGLSLTTITRLLSVVTALALGEQRSLAGLVLCDLVGSVLQRF
jgi:hypothetical protein